MVNDLRRDGGNTGSGVHADATTPTHTESDGEKTTMLLKEKGNAQARSAGVLSLAPALVIALLASQPAHAGQDGIQTAAGTSTPSCGLEVKPYPNCAVGSDEERVAAGYRINPVPLNLTGLDQKKVGIGSYWVNSAGNCDGCHAGAFTSVPGQYIPAENPANLPVAQGGTYAGKATYNGAIPYDPPATENALAFLGGGANFGNPAGACDASGMGACGATQLIVRNLTPDFSTGSPLPELNTLDHFKKTLRTGHDFKSIGLDCPGPRCVVAPADASKLQIMPWPALGLATDYDLESIYAYLTAIPCIANAGSPYPVIVHTCPAATDPKYGTASYHSYTYEHGHARRTD